MSDRKRDLATLDVLYIALAALQDMNFDLRKIGKGRHEDGAHPDSAIQIVRAEIAHFEHITA